MDGGGFVVNVLCLCCCSWNCCM